MVIFKIVPYTFLPNKKILLLISLFIITTQISFSQAPSIKGIVIDDSNTALEFASIALLKHQDSVIVSFSYTDNKGEFKITDSPSGSFLLQIYSIGFLPYYKNIDFKNKTINLNTIALTPTIEQLNEVTITAVIPIQIKKDTIAYNVNSFKIHHDDNIGDLLKKLPGIELDSDGNIVSQGNQITKIYVDGKEFFSGDPSIVLKNLSADAIKKVEVIDKKSDEAELTGINDEQKNFVINLTLKKSKKRSGFGKLAAGVGLNEKYFSNLNYNKFSPKTQVSIIGKFNNINITGSNIQNFLSTNGGLADDSEDNEEASTFENKNKSLSGNLTTGVGGVNLGYELKKKEVINVDYFYNYLENKGTSQSKKTSFSKLKNFQSESDDISDRITNNQHLNFNYKNKSSNKSRFFIKGYLTTDENISNLNSYVSYFNEDLELATSNDIKYFNKSERDKGNIRLNYYRKLNENKRNFSTSFTFNSNKYSSSKDQNNLNTNNSNQATNETITLRNGLFKNTNINFNFIYTEPLGNNHFLKLESMFVLKQGTEKTNQTKKRNGIDDLPLNFLIENKENSYNSKLTYAFSSETFNINLATELQHLYRDFGLIDVEAFKRYQAYLNPSLSIRYKPKKGKDYFIKYRRHVRPPKFLQSSPVVNDLNPYFIRKGNPNLKTEKLDEINFSSTIHNYKSSLSFYTKINYQHINDAIIPSLVITDDFIQTRSYINQGKQDKIITEFNLNTKIKSVGIRYNLKAKGLYNSANSIIEFELNNVISKEYLVGISIENNNKNLFDFKTGANYSVNSTTFSVIENLNREYIKHHYFSKIDYDLSKKLNLNTQFDYYFYTDSNFQSNQKIPYWSASMSYAFTKNNNAIVKLLLIDILDKNVNIIRKSTINYFKETTNQTLGRYFILSLTMRLNSKMNT